MSVEVILIVAVVWVVLGLINGWVLHQLGRSGWRLVALCALAGPLSLSIVYDEVRPADTDDPATAGDEHTEAPEQAASAGPFVDDVDETASAMGESLDWPTDDPEGRFILKGYRGLSDH